MSTDNREFRKVFFAGFILPLGLFGFSWGKIQLAREGKSDYAIIQGASPSEAEQFAARELGDYLEKVTGARLPILGETNVSGDIHGIYVGWTEFAARNGLEAGKLGREEWIIRTVGKNLVLTGGRPMGTLYAVYEFLEKTVGCHWLDRDTEIIPRTPDLAIAKMKTRGQPVFWHRFITPGYTIYQPDPAVPGLQEKEGVFRTRNKSTGWLARFRQPTYGYPNVELNAGFHTFYTYSKNFPTNHPEYFSMNKKGQRERATSGGGPGQVCLTNPETRKLFLEQLRKFIIQDRQAAARRNELPPWIYEISMNDCSDGHMCSCPSCLAFSDKEGSDSGPLVDFINEIAAGIKDEYPDVRVLTFAYFSTVKPPRTLVPRDNVIIQLAQWWPNISDILRPMEHPNNQMALEELAAWSKLSRHLAIWDYWVLYSDKFPTPYVNVACIQPDLQLFLKNHVENVFVECEFPHTTSFSALKLWLGQKLLQDPNQPQAPLLETFMNGYYGAAMPQMKAYLDYMEKRIASVPGTNKLVVMREYQRPYLDLEFFTTAYRLLTEAEQACRSDPKARAHVQHEWVPVCGGLYNMWSQLEQQVAKGQKMPFDRDEVLQKYATQRRAILEAFYYGQVPRRYIDEVDKEVKDYRTALEAERRKANPKIAPGLWTHVVVTYDRDGNMTRYVNGAPYDAAMDISPAKGISMWCRDRLQIGSLSTLAIPATMQIFNGAIDEVKVYGCSLSADEISDLYHNYGYTTTNYPGRVLVRQCAMPEPSAGLGLETRSDKGNGSRMYRRDIMLSPATPSANYQVPVTLATTNFNYAQATTNGGDLLFTDNSDGALEHWIENWDTRGESKLWVKVAASKTSSIRLYYGGQETSIAVAASNVFVRVVGDASRALKGAWNFDETSGTNVFDTSGNTNTGCAIAASITNGKFGHARFFQGGTDTVQTVNIGDAPSCNFSTSDFSIEAWIRPATNITGAGCIIARYDGAPLWYFRINPGNALESRMYIDSNNNYQISSGP